MQVLVVGVSALIVVVCLIRSPGYGRMTLLSTVPAAARQAGALAPETPTLRGYVAFRHTNPCHEGFHMCGTKEGGTVCLPAEQRCTQCTEDEKKCFDSRGKDYCIPKLKACPKESLTLLCPKGTKICRQSQGRHFCELMDHDCPDLKAAEIKRLKSKLAKYKAQQVNLEDLAADSCMHSLHALSRCFQIAPQGSAQMSIKDMFNSLRKDMPIVQKIPAASTFAPTNLAFNSKAVSKQMDALTNNLKMVQVGGRLTTCITRPCFCLCGSGRSWTSDVCLSSCQQSLTSQRSRSTRRTTAFVLCAIS